MMVKCIEDHGRSLNEFIFINRYLFESLGRCEIWMQGNTSCMLAKY